MSGRNYLESHSRFYTYANRRYATVSVGVLYSVSVRQCRMIGRLTIRRALNGTPFLKVSCSWDKSWTYPVNEELRKKRNLININYELRSTWRVEKIDEKLKYSLTKNSFYKYRSVLITLVLKLMKECNLNKSLLHLNREIYDFVIQFDRYNYRYTCWTCDNKNLKRNRWSFKD